MAEDWKLQVSYKTNGVDMVNIRAHTADELSILLEGISDYSTQIAATGRMLSGASVVAPLGTTISTPVQQHSPTFVTAPTSGALDTGVEETIHDRWGNVWVYNKPGAPTCIRGTMVLKSGISQAGKAYKCWSDPASGPKWPGERIPKELHAPIVWA